MIDEKKIDEIIKTKEWQDIIRVLHPDDKLTNCPLRLMAISLDIQYLELVINFEFSNYNGYEYKNLPQNIAISLNKLNISVQTLPICLDMLNNEQIVYIRTEIAKSIIYHNLHEKSKNNTNNVQKKENDIIDYIVVRTTHDEFTLEGIKPEDIQYFGGCVVFGEKATVANEHFVSYYFNQR